MSCGLLVSYQGHLVTRGAGGFLRCLQPRDPASAAGSPSTACFPPTWVLKGQGADTGLSRHPAPGWGQGADTSLEAKGPASSPCPVKTYQQISTKQRLQGPRHCQSAWQRVGIQ